MRILVTGAGGMLGQAVTAEAVHRGVEVLPMTREQLDITHEPTVNSVVADHRPDIVVHCAGYTDVDGAESAEADAMLLNATSAEMLGRATTRLGCLLVYPSTDYVFDGTAGRPYRPDDPVSPLNVYGRTKVAGEEATLSAGGLVVRTSWLFGAGGRNFVDTILARAQDGRSLRVVDDQIGRPTWTNDLAAVLLSLACRHASGIFHASGAGDPVSWYGFASAVLERSNTSTNLKPVTTAAVPRAADRPMYSVLDLTATESILGRQLVPWKRALGRYLAERRGTVEIGATDG